MIVSLLKFCTLTFLAVFNFTFSWHNLASTLGLMILSQIYKVFLKLNWCPLYFKTLSKEFSLSTHLAWLIALCHFWPTGVFWDPVMEKSGPLPFPLPPSSYVRLNAVHGQTPRKIPSTELDVDCVYAVRCRGQSAPLMFPPGSLRSTSASSKHLLCHLGLNAQCWGCCSHTRGLTLQFRPTQSRLDGFWFIWTLWRVFFLLYTSYRTCFHAEWIRMHIIILHPLY